MTAYDPIEFAHPEELIPGFYTRVPDHVYQDLPFASFHRLLPAIKGQTWAHYKAALEAADVSTEAMIIGKATHLACLQPEAYRDTVIDGPLNPKTGKGYGLGTQKVQQAQAQQPELLVLPREERIRVDTMAREVRNHPAAQLFLNTPYCYEITGIADVETQHGTVRVKFRPDIWIPEEGTIADLKSTVDASDEAFSRDIAKYFYHCQAALYLELSTALGYSVDTFAFIAVENTPTCWTPSGATHGVATYLLGDQSLDTGRILVRGALAGLARCQATNEWPGYPTQIETLDVPMWALIGGDHG